MRPGCGPSARCDGRLRGAPPPTRPPSAPRSASKRPFRSSSSRSIACRLAASRSCSFRVCARCSASRVSAASICFCRASSCSAVFFRASSRWTCSSLGCWFCSCNSAIRSLSQSLRSTPVVFKLGQAGVQLRLAMIEVLLPRAEVFGQLDRLRANLPSGRFRLVGHRLRLDRFVERHIWFGLMGDVDAGFGRASRGRRGCVLTIVCLGSSHSNCRLGGVLITGAARSSQPARFSQPPTSAQEAADFTSPAVTTRLRRRMG